MVKEHKAHEGASKNAGEPKVKKVKADKPKKKVVIVESARVADARDEKLAAKVGTPEDGMGRFRLKNIGYRAGVLRIDDDAYDALRELADKYLTNVVDNIVLLSLCSGSPNESADKKSMIMLDQVLAAIELDGTVKLVTGDKAGYTTYYYKQRKANRAKVGKPHPAAAVDDAPVVATADK